MKHALKPVGNGIDLTKAVLFQRRSISSLLSISSPILIQPSSLIHSIDPLQLPGKWYTTPLPVVTVPGRLRPFTTLPPPTRHLFSFAHAINTNAIPG